MRDFFERQETARKRTTLLIVLFAIAVILIAMSVYFGLTGYVYASFVANGERAPFAFWQFERFMVVFTITLLVIVSGTAYKINQLKEGGFRVAQLFGGRLLQRGTRDADERKLLNVVEEMAIASGVPVPNAYVLDGESGINAFAAGHGTEDAVVCVTSGCLKLLSRDELQAVVAHEFSHIFNGDMALNIRLMGWLNGILLIGLTGQWLLRSLRYVRGKGAAGIVALGVVLYVLGAMGLFFGKLIKSAVSRQREFLADASAVQFTRNPLALAGALEKVGGLGYGSRVNHPRAPEASHMFFCEGIGESLTGLMDTHPPLEERIRLVDPSWDGTYPKVVVPPLIELPKVHPPKPLPGGIMPTAISGAAAAAILDTIGAPMEEHAQEAKALLSELPEPVREASHELTGACAIVYVLLLDSDTQVRQAQIDFLKEIERSEVAAEAESIAGYLPSAPPRLRLPLVDLCYPTLQGLSNEQYKAFKSNIYKLMKADRKISTFEFVLNLVLLKRLDAFFMKNPRQRTVQIYNVRGVEPECSVVLSALARAGQSGEEQAKKAFESGKTILVDARTDFDFLPAGECTLKALDSALEKLATASPLIKKKLMAACLETIVFDKSITEDEAELFRAVGESLGVPVPPWLMFRAA